jgi:hypothetical protein
MDDWQWTTGDDEAISHVKLIDKGATGTVHHVIHNLLALTDVVSRCSREKMGGYSIKFAVDKLGICEEINSCSR